jgi:hypothetical protein
VAQQLATTQVLRGTLQPPLQTQRATAACAHMRPLVRDSEFGWWGEGGTGGAGNGPSSSESQSTFTISVRAARIGLLLLRVGSPHMLNSIESLKYRYRYQSVRHLLAAKSTRHMPRGQSMHALSISSFNQSKKLTTLALFMPAQ